LMTDTMRTSTYSRIKEAMAAGKFPAESGASQIPEVIVAQSDGRLDFKDAERISAMRAMGKANTLFRHGSNAKERETVIDFLWVMVKREETREGKPRWRFPKTTCKCVAMVAADETCWDVCPTCKGAGVVPMDFANSPPEGRMPMVTCGTCQGTRKRRYTLDERAKALIAEIRKDKRLHGFIEAIEWCRGKLLEAERMAVEGAAQMLERA